LVIGRRRRNSLNRLVVLVTVVAATVSPPDLSARSREWSADRNHLRVEGTARRTGLQRALDGSESRLSTPRCSLILDMFEDDAGQSLWVRLRGTGNTSRQHLRNLLFYDGVPENCGPRVLAYTTPGGSVVFLCPAFHKAAQGTSEVAESTIIHEFLHTLGLGEDPPSSREITSRVMQQCFF
jgi:hypothetical protein